jgi:acyl-CoA thioester hydrolase
MPQSPPKRKEFQTLIEIKPRWRDADVYGHINNAVYYEYVDTAVNEWLIAKGGMDVPHGDHVGLVVHSECQYFAPLHFPGRVLAGLSAAKIGNTSVTYRVALFEGDGTVAAALALFTHVYVDKESRRPKVLPSHFRVALERLG